jgi:2,4-dienoyl-CoA reductase-like NADH-dependent reductase (Old Yellow Enzyme family)
VWVENGKMRKGDCIFLWIGIKIRSKKEVGMYPHLFSKITVGRMELKNRLTMAPLYLGYAGEGGTVSELFIDHYRLMAKSGVAMVVVENATIDYPTGSGSNRTLRVDTDENMEGLTRLSNTIKEQGAVACQQINHAGRFAAIADPALAPSAVQTFGRMPRALTKEEMRTIARKFADAAVRVKKAGFDMVELHGGTGYLLSSFVSPRTNQRHDEYGGSLENRQRFPLEVVREVKTAVGNFPVGYRFLADEWLPDGLTLVESVQYAKALAAAGVAYISVMGGTYESFFLPHVIEASRNAGYMVDLAAAVKKAVNVPVITAGRIANGAFADNVIKEGKADLIGLARVLWADPDWPSKVKEGREDEIIHCVSECDDTCTKLVTKGKVAFCVRWNHAKLQEWKGKER